MNTARVWTAGLACLVLAAAATAVIAKDKRSDLQKNLNDTEVAESWIYDDFDKGLEEAAKTGRPLCVVFR